MSLAKLRELSRIQERAALADSDPDFSARIREECRGLAERAANGGCA
jgi:hypothetical protein